MTEVARLEESPISAAELEKAKNQILTITLRQRETNNGKASAIGQAAILAHDAEEVNSGLARLQAVTAADVQRVMKKYIGGGKPVVITYVGQPEGGKP